MARDNPPLDGLDLNLLVTLRALLREGSVTRAAVTLGQTQPTVSRSLATLRIAFGDPLLVRSGRSMVPTPLAAELRTPLERCLAALDRLPTVGDFDPARDVLTLRLTLPDVIGVVLVPALFERVQAEAPHVTLQILGTERDALISLLNDEVELVVGAPVLEHPELYSRRLGAPLGWSVVYGPRHRAWSSAMDLEAWLSSEHVQLSPAGRPDGPSPMDQLLAAEGWERIIRLHLGYLSALGPTLERTPVVMSLPTVIARHVAEGLELRVAPHPLGARLPRLELRMTWHQVHHAQPGHRWLRGVIVEEVERLGRGSDEAARS